MRHRVVLAMALLFSTVAALHGQTNLLENGTFTGGLSPWTVLNTGNVQADFVPSAVLGGDHVSVRSLTTSSYACDSCIVFYSGLYQTVPVTGGTTYTLTSGISPTANRSTVFIDWVKADGTPADDYVYPTQPFAEPSKCGACSAGHVVIVPLDGSLPLYTVTRTAPQEAAFATITITIEAVTGASADFDNVTFSALPLISSFTATPAVAAPGQPSQLSWSTSDATSLSIDNGATTAGLSPNGTITVSPDVTTTYTLTARSPNGSSTRSATVTVGNAASAGTVRIANVPTFADPFAGPFAVAAVPQSQSNKGRPANHSAAGTIFVLESDHTIRRIASDGTTSLYAGTPGKSGSTNGNRLQATFDFTDYSGALIAYADESLDVIDANGLQRHIDAAGNVTNPCISCTGTPGPAGMIRLADGTLLISSATTHQVVRIDGHTGVRSLIGNGTPGFKNGAPQQAEFNRPRGLTVDTSTGNVYVLDTGNNAIRTIGTDLQVSTLAAGRNSEGGPDTGGGDLTLGCCAGGIVPSPGGGVDVADPGANTIKHVAPDGTITTIAGSGTIGGEDGNADKASFNTPLGLTQGPSGALIVADTRNQSIRQVDAAPPPSCADPTVACLLGGRFTARLQYRAGFDNGAADTYALVKQVTGFANSNFETVFFYFNDPNNIEVLLKMLDQGNADAQGQPTIALLYGTATPLRIRVVVTDTLTGETKTYDSAFNAMQGKTDFTAFRK